MKTKLALCPVCRGQAERKTVTRPFQHGWVGCPVCKKHFQWVHDPQSAIKQWNAYALEGENNE